VTNFETENANESDQNALMPIIEELEDQCLKPDIVAADAGYASSKIVNREISVSTVSTVQKRKSEGFSGSC
jgi:hypothetical protein